MLDDGNYKQDEAADRQEKTTSLLFKASPRAPATQTLPSRGLMGKLHPLRRHQVQHSPRRALGGASARSGLFRLVLTTACVAAVAGSGPDSGAGCAAACRPAGSPGPAASPGRESAAWG